MSSFFDGLSSFEYITGPGARREIFETLHTEDLKTKFARWKNDDILFPNKVICRILTLSEGSWF